VTLAWETINPATSYRIKRATTEAGPYAVIGDQVMTTGYVDTTVQNGTTYYYSVSAIVDGQETPDSGARSASPVGVPKTVSWNFDRFGTVSGTAVAGVVSVANWNNTWPSNPVVNLIDSDGAATTLDISYSSYNTWSIQGSSPGVDDAGTSNKRLLNGYLNAGNAAWNPATTRSTIGLSEIPHAYYDIIVYFSADQAGREGEVTDGLTTYYFKTLGSASISGGNATLVQAVATSTNGYSVGANYAVFKGLTGTSQSISVQMRDNDEWGGIAGFQIVPQIDPLPATTVQIEVNAGSSAATLTWPSELGSVFLEQSTDLVEWLPADPQPNTNIVILTMDRPKCFYRLIRP
jgi:hypothetical protein